MANASEGRALLLKSTFPVISCCINHSCIHACVCYLGEFGSERLVQKVVDSILAQSAAPLAASSAGTSDLQPLQDPLDTFDPEMASKIILTGQKVGHRCVWLGIILMMPSFLYKKNICINNSYFKINCDTYKSLPKKGWKNNRFSN